MSTPGSTVASPTACSSRSTDGGDRPRSRPVATPPVERCCAAWSFPAWPTRIRTPSTARCGPTPSATRRFVLDVARGDVRRRRPTDPADATGRWPARCTPRWRSPGITAVGEFHYLHHDPGGVPYADPNEMGQALIAAAADAGVRLTLLDTCYLTAGADGAPPRRPAAAVRRRRRRPVGRAGRRAAVGHRKANHTYSSAPQCIPCAPCPPSSSARSRRGRRPTTLRCTCTPASRSPRSSSAWPRTAVRRRRCCASTACSGRARPRCTRRT